MRLPTTHWIYELTIFDALKVSFVQLKISLFAWNNFHFQTSINYCGCLQNMCLGLRSNWIIFSHLFFPFFIFRYMDHLLESTENYVAFAQNIGNFMTTQRTFNGTIFFYSSPIKYLRWHFNWLVHYIYFFKLYEMKRKIYCPKIYYILHFLLKNSACERDFPCKWSHLWKWIIW